MRQFRATHTAVLGVLLLGATWSCRERAAAHSSSATGARSLGAASAAASASAAALPIGSASSTGLGLASELQPARVYVMNRYVFVRPRPDVNADWLGFLWFGSSVELRGTKAVRGPGCATFYPIEPAGFVCVDQKQATLDPNDPVFRAVSRYAPRLDQPSPHHYAESRGVEFHSLLPGDEHELPVLPRLFHEPRRRMLPLSTIAFADERSVGGQGWLMSADLLWLRRDQVTLYPEITFHGVELGSQYRLPLAFFRQAGRAKYRRDASGKLKKSGESFALQSVLALGKEIQIQHGERYFVSAEGGDWVREQDAVLPAPRSLTPWGARVGSADHTGRAPKNARKTWIEVSVLGGWLLAYEGTRAVYATMISAGRGGIPKEGEDTLQIAATPTGTFPISGKLATVTMEAHGEFVHSDVPWTQNFQKPYAIHTAYWHNNWGNLQSGGCINVSPIDGKWLFEFTEPALPAGWHALRWRAALGAPTLLVVHE